MCGNVCVWFYVDRIQTASHHCLNAGSLPLSLLVTAHQCCQLYSHALNVFVDNVQTFFTLSPVICTCTVCSTEIHGNAKYVGTVFPFPSALLNLPNMHETLIDQHSPEVEICKCTLSLTHDKEYQCRLQ